MNAPTEIAIPDVQSSADSRRIAIAKVGKVESVVFSGSRGLPGRPAKLEGLQQFDGLHLAVGAASFEAGRQHLVGADGKVPSDVPDRAGVPTVRDAITPAAVTLVLSADQAWIQQRRQGGPVRGSVQNLQVFAAVFDAAPVGVVPASAELALRVPAPAVPGLVPRLLLTHRPAGGGATCWGSRPPTEPA